LYFDADREALTDVMDVFGEKNKAQRQSTKDRFSIEALPLRDLLTTIVCDRSAPSRFNHLHVQFGFERKFTYSRGRGKVAQVSHSNRVKSANPALFRKSA
jgi:hypothetical protein